MVSSIPSGSGTHICTKHTTYLCLLKPPMEEHSVLGWGEPFLGEEGADRERKRTFCGAVLLSDLFWNLSDSQRLAHKKGVALFGKRPQIFWQNCSQLQGQNVVCVSLWGCVSLMSWRFDGRRRRGGQPWVLHQCWVIRTHLFLFPGDGLWNWGGEERTGRGLLFGGLCVMVVLDTQCALDIFPEFPHFCKMGVNFTVFLLSCPPVTLYWHQYPCDL